METIKSLSAKSCVKIKLKDLIEVFEGDQEIDVHPLISAIVREKLYGEKVMIMNLAQAETKDGPKGKHKTELKFEVILP